MTDNSHQTNLPDQSGKVCDKKKTNNNKTYLQLFLRWCENERQCSEDVT